MINLKEDRYIQLMVAEGQSTRAAPLLPGCGEAENKAERHGGAKLLAS